MKKGNFSKTKKWGWIGGFAAACVLLLSWGVIGHRTVGKIAEGHLSPAAKAAVGSLLGSQTLADVSTWADEVRPTPEYRHTGPWHYINLPLGLSYADFEKKVEGMTEENVYSALLKEEHVLSDQATTRSQKVEALKFIVHFVGDLHQPMHVSRAEDKGGNSIQLNDEGSGTNLHAVWDSKLIEREGLGYEKLADECDHASPQQVRQWQADPLIRWIWESYEISSELYAEVDTMKTRTIGESYYQAHIGIIHQRLEQAGVRLAGVLNKIFEKGLASSAPEPVTTTGNGAAGVASQQETSPVDVDIHDAGKHIDAYARMCGKIFGHRAFDEMTLVNLGAAYPDQLLTVVLRGKAKDDYDAAIGGSKDNNTFSDGQTICVMGKIISYRDKPEIVVTDLHQITGSGH